MHLPILFILTLAAEILALTRCGTQNASESLHALHAAQENIDATFPRLVKRVPPTVINTYFHVVSTDSSLTGGNVPEEQITQQVCDHILAREIQI
jgi:hypothetical protein